MGITLGKLNILVYAVRVRCKLGGIEYIDTESADTDGNIGQAKDDVGQDREAGSM